MIDVECQCQGKLERARYEQLDMQVPAGKGSGTQGGGTSMPALFVNKRGATFRNHFRSVTNDHFYYWRTPVAAATRDACLIRCTIM